jgi:hypothetical protein
VLDVLLNDAERGPVREVVRDFRLVSGGGKRVGRRQRSGVVTIKSDRELLLEAHADELTRLEASYKQSLTRIDAAYARGLQDVDSRYAVALENMRLSHTAEIARLQGIIDKLIAKVGSP